MKKLIFKTASLFFMLIGFTISSINASHLVGGEITYKWLGANDYSVCVHLYRDCAGIPITTSASVQITSTSCGANLSISIPVDNTSPTMVSPVCASQVSNSACNGGTLYGIEEYTYTQTITLPSQCSDWVLSYSDCCRNAAITNLNNAGGQGFYIYTELDNQNVPFNNSPSFIHVPVYVIDDNVPQQLSWSALDSDGDSLVYSLTSALDGTIPGVPVMYANGITYQQPFITSTTTSLDPNNGIISINPNGQQICVVSMNVDEYRNGFHIGKIHRDFQIVVESLFNDPPSLSGINGNPIYAMSACPGVPINFTVNSFDSDTNQILNIHWDATIPNATFTTAGGNQPVGTFTWTPDTNDISSLPHLVILTVEDDNCPYFGTQTYAFQLYINQCNTYDVWPGDANADAHVDLTDLLNLGIAYNDTGASRINASLNWIAQPATNWSNTFASGINYKHADCDGNGIVDWNDTTAIMQNNGMNHPFRLMAPTVDATAADLFLVSNYDTIGPNTYLTLEVYLGTASMPVNNIYGISFGVTFDWTKILVNSTQVDLSNTWMGIPSSNLIALSKTDINGVVNIAATGINHTNQSGYGLIARISFLVVGNVSGLTPLQFNFSNLKAITSSEINVPLNTHGATVILDPLNPSAIENINAVNNISIYPNPSNHQDITITATSKISSIQIYTITGALVKQLKANDKTITIKTNEFAKGFYTLSVVTQKGITKHKLQIN